MRNHLLLAVAIVPLIFISLLAPARAEWNPAGFAQEETLELLTVGPEEGEYWSKVWLVVLDDGVYVRLGNRAAGRVRKNTRAPVVDVRIAGETFRNVRIDATPEMAEPVARAMSEKYWSDVFIRYLPHPLTARLVPTEGAM